MEDRRNIKRKDEGKEMEWREKSRRKEEEEQKKKCRRQDRGRCEWRMRDSRKKEKEKKEICVKAHLNMSGNGNKAEEEIMVVHECIFNTHICNNGHNVGDVGIPFTQNMRIVAVNKRISKT